MEVPVIVEPVVGEEHRATEADGPSAEAASWKDDAGYLQHEPLYEAWREAMEEHRRKLGDAPEAP
jgi:hypothetical protein